MNQARAETTFNQQLQADHNIKDKLTLLQPLKTNDDNSQP